MQYQYSEIYQNVIWIHDESEEVSRAAGLWEEVIIQWWWIATYIDKKTQTNSANNSTNETGLASKTLHSYTPSNIPINLHTLEIVIWLLFKNISPC